MTDFFEKRKFYSKKFPTVIKQITIINKICNQNFKDYDSIKQFFIRVEKLQIKKADFRNTFQK